MNKPTVIAEIGCNHMGDMNIAKEFIDITSGFCKVNAVKFQKRNVTELLTPEEYNTPHPVTYHSYGETYGKHREYLEFTIAQHRELKNYCADKNMLYGCSVWDMTSLKEIISLNPDFIKIPSATNTHFGLLEHLCKNYPGEVHISVGMTTREEERKIINFFEEQGRLNNLIVYSCTSGYPVPPEDVCLMEIERLKTTYGDKVKAIGFSGHHNGISIDVAAYTLGATYIERHFTLDRTWKGTDHAASLEPDGLRRLNRDLNNVSKSLAYKKKEILDIEDAQRKKLKWDRHDNSESAAAPAPEATAEKENVVIKLVLIDVDGVLTDSGMYYTEKGDELKKFNTRDGQGIALLREAGIKTGIITREDTEIVRRRAEKLKIDILHQGVTDKLSLVKKLISEQNLSSSNVCYIGDDIHDLDTIRYVGYSAVPRDAINECKESADYICRLQGGKGCVREVIDLILQKMTV